MEIDEPFPVRIGGRYLFEIADGCGGELELYGIVLSHLVFPYDGSYGIEIEEWRDGAPTGKKPRLFGARAFKVTTVQ